MSNFPEFFATIALLDAKETVEFAPISRDPPSIMTMNMLAMKCPPVRVKLLLQTTPPIDPSDMKTPGRLIGICSLRKFDG
jgi:hypothetical protein